MLAPTSEGMLSVGQLPIEMSSSPDRLLACVVTPVEVKAIMASIINEITITFLVFINSI